MGGATRELVLGAAAGWAGGLLLSAGTDGLDGTSEAAGAFLDDGVLAAAGAAGGDAADALTHNDADAFFAAGGGRVVTGPTGTNVADLCLYLR